MTILVVDSTLSAPSRTAFYINDRGAQSTTMFSVGPDLLQAEDMLRVAYAVGARILRVGSTCVSRRLVDYIESVEGALGVQVEIL